MGILNKVAFGTVDSVPFAPRSKMVSALGAAGLIAGAGAVGNVINGIFGSSANNKNVEI